VEPNPRDLSGRDEFLVLSYEAVDVERTTGVVREDESLVLPERT
jgi:hypothetical protein